MSVAVVDAYGIFEANDSVYKATAITAVKEMNFYGKTNFQKAEVVLETFQNKHPEYDWYSVCFSSGGKVHYRRSSVLTLRRDGFDFGVVAVHNKEKFDKLIKGKS